MSDKKKRFLVEYDLPYVHTVRVSVIATDGDEARALVSRRFDEGTLWNDEGECTLIADMYDESGDDADLKFKVTGYVDAPAAYEDPFKPDYSVIDLRRRAAALRACKALLEPSMLSHLECHFSGVEDKRQAANFLSLVRQARQAVGDREPERINGRPYG